MAFAPKLIWPQPHSLTLGSIDAATRDALFSDLKFAFNKYNLTMDQNIEALALYLAEVFSTGLHPSQHRLFWDRFEHQFSAAFVALTDTEPPS